MVKKLLIVLVLLVALLGVGWWMIGPAWRALLTDPPTNTDVLFWSVGQRDAGFRMLDQVPALVESRVAQPHTVRPLPTGQPLSLDVDVEEYVATTRLASLIVLHKGQIRLERYGLDFSAEGRWTSFSVAKSFTSTLVGAALQDGYISSLSSPVTDYIPGLAGSPYDDVTIEQLLTMTSGVDWNEDYDDPQSDVAQFNQHQPQDGLPVVVSYMRNLSRAHPPGTVWNYSTGETNLIGILVSQATGKTLTEYLTEKIWQPAGMQQTGTWLVGIDGHEISGCCIQAATRDFARFGQFVLEGAVVNGESIVPGDWFAAATRRQTSIGQAGRGYGFQWWTYDDGAFAARGIFGQGIFVDPQRDLVIASNSNWTSAIGRVDGENVRRESFYQAVQRGIDQEVAVPSAR